MSRPKKKCFLRSDGRRRRRGREREPTALDWRRGGVSGTEGGDGPLDGGGFLVDVGGVGC